MVATGQTGKNPFICVWDTATMETVSILRDGHQNGIAAVGFDKDGGVSFGHGIAVTGFLRPVLRYSLFPLSNPAFHLHCF
jgi:hypothetical protein